MAEVVLKYASNVYQAKINSLESCTSRLQTHLDRLQELKGEMTQFWEDDKVQDYASLIQENINNVQTSMDRVADLKAMYQKYVDESARQSSVMDTIIDSVKSAMEMAKAGTGAGGTTGA